MEKPIYRGHRKPQSQYQLCREFRLDFWGNVMNSDKGLRPLYLAIYNPYRRRPANFILRIDKTRPKRRFKVLTPYAQIKSDQKKLTCYYGLSLSHLRHLAFRTRNTRANGLEGNFILTLECMLFSLCLRTRFFRNTFDVKTYIKSGNLYVNSIRQSSPAFRCSPGDLIEFKNLTYSQYFFVIKRKYFRFREKHFLFNYRLNSLYFLKYPDYKKPFFYSPLRHKCVFFNRRFRFK